jgi:arginine/lysine/ornithine decarboxylase
MTYLKSWEEFEKAAERLYFQDPMKVGLNAYFDFVEWY